MLSVLEDDYKKLSVRMLAGVWLTSLLAVFLFNPYFVAPYDEGIILTGAMRVAGGEVPSKDFYTNYGPAQFYLLAAAFNVFGQSVTVARIYDALVTAAIFPACAWLVSGLLPRGNLIGALGVILVFVLLFHLALYPDTPSLLLILIGAGVMVRVVSKDLSARSYIIPAGVIGGVIFFRYDMGMVALLSFATPMAAVFGLQALQGVRTWRDGFIKLTLFSAISTIFVLAILFALAQTGILAPALSDILNYNAQNYVEMRSLPFPSVFSQNITTVHEFIAIYLPFFAFALGIYSVLAIIRREGESAMSRRRGVTLLLATILTGLCSLKGMVRTDAFHMLLADIPGVLLVALSIKSLSVRSERRRDYKTARIPRALYWAAYVSLFLVGLAPMLGDNYVLRNIGESDISMSTDSLGIFGADADKIEAARYIARITEPEERILSATGRHDKIFVNDIAFYFITQRLPGTRWHQYDPGVQTTRPIQEDMIRELEEFNVRIIVKNDTWDHYSEINGSAKSSGVFILDEYIAQNYREIKRFGAIAILERK